jgi:phosphatidylserine/phosphatidylglycerophosphate/cardiolipin synthase-like enzyme
MKQVACWLLAAGLATTVAAAAPPAPLPARGNLQVAFSPGDDVGGLVVAAIREARRQILVQAYSFTHKHIADALVEARQRGVDVQMLADHDQARSIATSLVEDVARRGVPVWLDGEHAAAHNKVMVIDPGLPTAAVVTGSLNFTQAGQYRNAENVLILRGNPDLAEAYAANWRQHRLHSQPVRR